MNKKRSNLKNKFASIDLGSNNCRLLIVEFENKKKRDLLRFSKVLNLAKNLTYSNEFTGEKINSVINFFKIIAKKMYEFDVLEYRCIATHACREAINSSQLIEEIYKHTGIKVEIISTEEEARLSLKSNMIYKKKPINCDFVLDIGGGSTELVFIKKLTKNISIDDFEFISLPLGVINLSEKIEVFGEEYVNNFINKNITIFKEVSKKKINVIGSCGTITSICAIHKNLKYYDKKKVDGVVMKIEDIKKNCIMIKKMTNNEKNNHPCIGKNRKELLDNGVKILESILDMVEIENIVVSDRGLIDGMIEDYNF
ncbi:hypothetical protein OA848_01290 [Rickettsiales bacterium]|nr:hypothetical protein [Rickettsiales bacterium]